MKRKSLRLKVLLLVLSLPCLVQGGHLSSDPDAHPSMSWSEAQEWSWTSRLRLQANVAYDQKPSSIRDQNSLEWGSLDFMNLWDHDGEPFEVAVAGHVGPDRDSQRNQPAFLWDELRFTWKHKPSLSFGVLVDPVIHFDDREWGETVTGSEFDAGVSRWGLIPASDLGLQWGLTTPVGYWTLQVTNGEGFPNSEVGPRKDIELVWEQPFLLESSLLRTQAFYRIGGYDNKGAPAQKVRGGLQFALKSEIWSFGLVGMTFTDPVDAITGVLGEGVDLTAKGGGMNHGALQEAWAQYRWGERPLAWRALVRSAKLQCDLTDSDKDVSSVVAGVGKSVGPGMQVDLLFQQADFGKTHSIHDQDRQRWFLAWAWGLERHPEH